MKCVRLWAWPSRRYARSHFMFYKFTLCVVTVTMGASPRTAPTLSTLDSLSSTLNARLRFQPAPKSAFEVMPLLLLVLGNSRRSIREVLLYAWSGSQLGIASRLTGTAD